MYKIKRAPGLIPAGARPFHVEFACSPRVFVGFPLGAPVSSHRQNMHVRAIYHGQQMEISLWLESGSFMLLVMFINLQCPSQINK